MIDQRFGSHYVQSAIDLAVQAERQLTGPVPNNLEAKRLYGHAVTDMHAGLVDIKNNREQLQQMGVNLVALAKEIGEFLNKWHERCLGALNTQAAKQAEATEELKTLAGFLNLHG